jgi:hypothetical protein
MAFKMRGPVMYSSGDSANSSVEVKPVEMNFEIPGMKEYQEHVANTPRFEEGGGLFSKIKTLGKRFVHNTTGPTNPLMNTGGGALDLIGGKGAYKFLSRGFAKLAAKQAAKKGIGKITN